MRVFETFPGFYVDCDKILSFLLWNFSLFAVLYPEKRCHVVSSLNHNGIEPFLLFVLH